MRLVESATAWCCSEASHATAILLVLRPAMPATGTVEKLVAAAISLVLRLAMPATSAVEELAVLATILLVLRLAMPATWYC